MTQPTPKTLGETIAFVRKWGSPHTKMISAEDFERLACAVLELEALLAPRGEPGAMTIKHCVCGSTSIHGNTRECNKYLDQKKDDESMNREVLGATRERAAIVKYLRAKSDRISSFVDEIEAGEHLKP